MQCETYKVRCSVLPSSLGRTILILVDPSSNETVSALTGFALSVSLPVELHLMSTAGGGAAKLKPTAVCLCMHLAAKVACRLDSPELVIECE